MRIEAQMTATTGCVMALQPTPALIAFTELLAMAAPDLEEWVERELASNPALDRDDGIVCPVCGEAEPTCRCAGADRATERPAAADVGADLLERFPCRRTLPQRLLDDLRLLLDRPDHPIAEYLAGSLDERGRLVEAPAEAAAALGLPLARVEAVLCLMRRIGPPGIAAANGRECLLLQLDRWEAAHPPEPLVRRDPRGPPGGPGRRSAGSHRSRHRCRGGRSGGGPGVHPGAAPPLPRRGHGELRRGRPAGRPCAGPA